MELSIIFKGVIDGDEQPVVICNLEHEIIYMNPAAVKRYESAGGAGLVGKSLLNCHNPRSVEIIRRNIDMMSRDKSVNRIFEVHSTRHGGNNDVYTVAVRDESGELIGYYEKFEDKNLYIEEK
ncbi:PAS domain-containing protein [Ruminococcus sp. Marseille-P6503]|uniref:PAS domain-containing protein n=1 Tax=Ruminococcus sp. Marseille-P6503 TaxID=2364796 RepID=UPI000F528C1D|nr:PAS domain-containing protein [Ruminococcus sp. Marseille-P6503]